MTNADFVKQMQADLRKQQESDELATKNKLHDVEVTKTDGPRKWLALKDLLIKSVSGINAGFPAIVLDYSEDEGTESITVKNVMAYRVMTANFGANAVIAYRSPAASGSFLPRITGNELTFAWENVIPSRRVPAAIEQIGNIITLEQMSELLIRCVVSP
jgi:hypothetical protein